MRVLPWVLLLAATGPAAPAAAPTGTPIGRAALATCLEARGGDDVAALDAALAEAEAAADAEPDDPVAHFALFCALGERMRARGMSLRSLYDLRRLRGAVDRSLELAPDYADALHGKANLLLDAPPFFGRDVAEAGRLLRRALELEPDHLEARLDLARTLARLGQQDAAVEEARRALAQAEQGAVAADVARAKAVLAKVGGAE